MSGTDTDTDVDSESTDPELLAGMNAALAQLVPRAHDMGVRFAALRPGYARTTVPFEGNGNHFGVVYAGVVFTLAEVLGGGIASSTFDPTTHYPLVRELSIRYLAPGRGALTAETSLDEETIARVRAESVGADGTPAKASFELRAVVTGADGTVVAETVGDYQIRPFGR